MQEKEGRLKITFEICNDQTWHMSDTKELNERFGEIIWGCLCQCILIMHRCLTCLSNRTKISILVDLFFIQGLFAPSNAGAGVQLNHRVYVFFNAHLTDTSQCSISRSTVRCSSLYIINSLRSLSINNILCAAGALKVKK